MKEKEFIVRLEIPQERDCKSCSGCSRVSQAQHRCSSTCLFKQSKQTCLPKKDKRERKVKEAKLLQIAEHTKHKAFVLFQYPPLALELGYESQQ